TALVEHYDGTMEILHWAEEMAKRESEAASGVRLAAA
ncbi:UDP-2,3-diacylglucosamine diphosphatase, partial [Escherichia coli]|nr:UDP-2,3-diacylglucosamine diphosphatase [Escherichia coli]